MTTRQMASEGADAKTTATVRALVLEKGSRRPESRLIAAPEPAPGEVLVRTLLTGIDGTDEEVLANGPAAWPGNGDAIVLGHECLGEVVAAPSGSGLSAGDRVVPLVRHGCGRCAPCGRGHQDLCATGDYREHGIKGLDGFMREYWSDEPAALVKVPRELGAHAVLVEPMSIAVKAVEMARHVQRRIPYFEGDGGFRGRRALVAGTGSLGTLGAFLLRLEGMEVWAMDRSPGTTLVARLLSDVGVRHVNAKERDIQEVARKLGGFDLVLEATGAAPVAFDLALTLARNGVLCMLGVPAERPAFPLEGDDLMRNLVLRNQVVLGSVNSNRAHFERAAETLLAVRARWPDALDRFVTDTFAPEDAAEAFTRSGDATVKKVIDWRA